MELYITGTTRHYSYLHIRYTSTRQLARQVAHGQLAWLLSNPLLTQVESYSSTQHVMDDVLYEIHGPQVIILRSMVG